MAKSFKFEFKIPNLPKAVYSKMRAIKEHEGVSWRCLVIAGHLAFMDLHEKDPEKFTATLGEAKNLDDASS